LQNPLVAVAEPEVVVPEVAKTVADIQPEGLAH
jgi:hypothetical protein